MVVRELGAKADLDVDKIAVDGIGLTNPKKEQMVYLLLNKPKGYISSVTDPLGRPVVTDIVSGVVKWRVWPVGRLDFDAEGVLLLTNDGELANKLIHPKFKVPKKYLVKVRGIPVQAVLDKLEKGVRLEDGMSLPAKARLIRTTTGNSWIELTVFEGRNRLVKRMCKAVGHPVQKLQRISFAGIRLGSLKAGAWRSLTLREVEDLRRV